RGIALSAGPPSLPKHPSQVAFFGASDRPSHCLLLERVNSCCSSM
uniref:Uncharacterized protein n=1 Tax=Triticum urartu TaxID=4572 RepID=A0A8R7UG49_TRIUA